MGNRRNFIKSIALAGIATSFNLSFKSKDKSSYRNKFLHKDDCLKITGTFIDELSRDMPFHNWGLEEWDKEFSLMKSIGINTIVLPQVGLDLKLLYPSALLAGKGLPHPSFDKLDLLLTLADKWGFKVYCGLYKSHHSSQFLQENITSINRSVSSEIWDHYGSRHRSFDGWFISSEVSMENRHNLAAIVDLCKHCKAISGNKKVIISPWIDGNRLLDDDKAHGTYTAQWNEIMSHMSQAVDICTIQDTGINDLDCASFYQSCQRIAQSHGIKCWGNAETYDAQMPMRLYSTDFDHLRLKLSAARAAGLEKVITYEFSHFMSPQSVCQSGSCLLNRYKEYFDLS